MSPWEVMGWIFAALLLVILVAVLAVLIFFCVSFSLYLRDKKREIAAAEKAEKDRAITVPHFESMKPGDIFAVDYQSWKIIELMSDFDIDRNRQRIRIEAESLSRL